MLQLAAEIFAALGVVEGESRQSVDDPISADVAAEDRLDADNADDDVFRYPVFACGALERLGVAGPELGSGVDSLRLDEDRAVSLPRLGRLGRLVHRPDDRRLILPARAPGRSLRLKPCFFTISATNSFTSLRFW
jgi:hypothetical protein